MYVREYFLGIREPFLVSNPVSPATWGKHCNVSVSLVDVAPTILDWFHIKKPNYSILDKKTPVRLQGTSLLPLTSKCKSGAKTMV